MGVSLVDSDLVLRPSLIVLCSAYLVSLSLRRLTRMKAEVDVVVLQTVMLIDRRILKDLY